MKKFFLGIVFSFFFMAVLFSQGVRIADVMDVADGTISPYNQVVRSGKVFEKSYESPGSAFMAVHFSYFKLAPGDYVLISSANEREQFVFAENGKKGSDGKFMPDFWSRRVKGSTITITLIGQTTAKLDSSYHIQIDKISCGFSQEELDRIFRGESTREICGADDKKWAKCYLGTAMYDKAKAVARLAINASSACTGWLIGSEGHLITNNHCFSDQASADNTEYEFMAEGETCETDCSEQLSCPGAIESTTAQLIKTMGQPLDYTLVKLPVNLTGKYGFMQLRQTLPDTGERIYIPQHAGAKGKELAVACDQTGGFAQISGLNATDILYKTDTEAGSSGSPVLGYSDNLAVGLHHLGGCDNKAVRIPALINDLGLTLPANSIGGPGLLAADFTFTTAAGSTDVQFTDASRSNGCVITGWIWNFGDGSSSTLQNPPSHHFAKSGIYYVSQAIVSDQQPPRVNTMTKTVVVPPLAQYCASASGGATHEWIVNVQIGSFANPSAASTYSDFSGLVVNMVLNQTYTAAITQQYGGSAYTEYFVIWIDWNHNGVFTDTGEEVFYKSGNAPVSGTITVPGSALTGPTRMRVTMRYQAKPGPCDSFSYGEVEDYTVFVYASDLAPVANFYSTQVPGTLTMQFIDLSTDDQLLNSWSWDFDNNGTSDSTLQNPNKTFSAAGSYSVSLEVKDATGQKNKKTVSVTIGSGITKDSFIASFSGAGFWIWNPNTNQWSKLNDLEPSQIAIGDFDGNGKNDTIGAFGIGLWIRLDSGAWQKVENVSNPLSLAAGDTDGDGRADIVGVWEGIGVWTRTSGSNAWTKILDKGAIQIDCADFDQDNLAEILGWWNPEGLWIYDMIDNKWSKVLDQENLAQIASGDMNGDKRPDVLGIWTHGIWTSDLVTADWTRLFEKADLIASGDLNGSGKADLIGIWPGVPGVWVRFSEDSSWQKIHDTKPLTFKAGRIN